MICCCWVGWLYGIHDDIRIRNDEKILKKCLIIFLNFYIIRTALNRELLQSCDAQLRTFHWLAATIRQSATPSGVWRGNDRSN